MNNQRQLITGLLSAVSVIALGIATAQAVDIRDDQFGNNLDTDPNNIMFPTVVALSTGCTGTLIDRRTILTAAHCVVDTTTDTDITTLTAGTISFRQDGVTTLGTAGVWAISSVEAHPLHDNDQNEADIAIITLDLSVTDIAPQVLGTANPSVGDVITIAGHGISGTGTNPGVTSDNQRRFATNTVDSVVAVGPGFQIRFDFDDPTIDITALPFEGGHNQGDSGGPMFISDGIGGWIQVGVTRGRNGAISGYGQVSDYASVPSFLPYIDPSRGMVFTEAVAGDGVWTDTAQWDARTRGTGADYALALAPDNYDQGSPLLQEDIARYFDVVIDVDGTKTVENGDDVDMDTLRLNHADATLLIEVGATLKAVLDRIPLFTAGVDYAGILLDQGTLDNDGNVETPVYIQNGGTAEISGSLMADDLTLNGGILDDEGTGTVQAIRFIQTGGLLVGGPEIQLDPVTGALLPGQDVDGFVGATFSALAPGGTVNALGADGIDVLGGGGANYIVIKTSDTDGIGTDSSISTAGIGILVDNDIAGASGNIIIEIDGDIESTGDDAVRVRAGQSTGTVVVTGAANLTGGPNAGNDGIDIINGGSIFVDIDGTISGDPGINVSSILGGNITILGVGDVIGNPNEGIFASTTNGDGNILITRDGNISGSTGIEAITDDSGSGLGDITINILAGHTVDATTGHGISTSADRGRTEITTTGNIGTDGMNGINAVSVEGAISIFVGTGNVVEAINGAVGILANTLSGDFTNLAPVTIQGTGGVTGGTHGIFITTDHDDILIEDLTAITGIASTGISATSGGGNILVQNIAATSGATDGMNLSALGGDGTGTVTVNLSAGQTIQGTSGDGIDATASNGAIIFNIGGQVGSDGTHGIDARSADGPITFNILSGATVEANDGLIGIKADTSDGDMTTTGKIFVQGEGSVTGGTHAIFLETDNDDILVQNLFVVTGSGGTGITATSLGGDILVQDINNVTGSAEGAFLSAAGGDGNGKITVIVKDGTNISGGTGHGVDATTTNGAMEFNVLGTIASTDAIAIKATSSDGSIRINLGADGNVTANTGLGGILASTSNGDMTDTGTITVEGAGNVSGGTFGISASTDNDAILIQDLISLTGMGAEGLLATSLGGTITVDDIATVSGATHGLSLTSSGGDIAINEVGSVGGVTGAGGMGVAAAASGGNITFGTVTANGPVMGTVGGVDLSTTGTGGIIMIADADITGGTGYGIKATSGSGATDITVNAGVIISAASDLAVLFTSIAGTANSLLNNGTILGAVTGGAGDETFTNVSSETWVPSGLDGGPSTSDFGAGTDAIINPGVIQVYDSAGPNLVAAEATVLGLESLTNSGIITMQNGEGNASLTTDRFSLSSETALAYIGDDGMLLVDSFLGTDPAPGDLLTLGLAGGTEGSTSGLTTIFVNDTDSGSPGVFNPIGVEVVRVESLVAGANTSSDHFVLDGGPIDKGLWIWDLGLDDTRANPGRAMADVHVLYSRPSDIVMFTPYFGTGALTAFHASLEPWLDRQQTLEQSIETYSHRRTPGGNVAGSRRYIDLWLTPYGGRRSEDSAASLTFFGETFTSQMNYDQYTAGVQGGVDFVFVQNSTNALMAGAFGGYVTSEVQPDDTSVSGDYDGGTAGIYANLLHGNFNLSAVAKMDFLSFEWTSPALSESADSAVNTLGTRIEATYKKVVSGEHAWVEPYANITYASSSWDPFEVLGTTFAIDNNKSIVGRTGMRAGTRLMDTGPIKTDVYVGAGIIHEFKKKNTADIMSGGFTLPLEHKVDQTGLELQGGVSFNDGGRFSVLATSSARIHRDTVEYGGKITANVRF